MNFLRHVKRVNPIVWVKSLLIASCFLPLFGALLDSTYAGWARPVTVGLISFYYFFSIAIGVICLFVLFFLKYYIKSEKLFFYFIIPWPIGLTLCFFLDGMKINDILGVVYCVTNTYMVYFSTLFVHQLIKNNTGRNLYYVLSFFISFALLYDLNLIVFSAWESAFMNTNISYWVFLFYIPLGIAMCLLAAMIWSFKKARKT